MWKLRKFDYIIIGLFIIGIISMVSSNPKNYIIPIVVLGLVFLLYKFPPGRNKRVNGKHRSPRRRANKPNLRVIQGSKKDDDDKIPPYH